MGYVRTPALIGPGPERLQEVRFLVDSGAFFTFLPEVLAEQLDIATTITGPVRIADSSVVQVQLGMAYLRLMDREGGIPIGIMEVPEPLLGVTALEGLGLKINPVTEALEYAASFGAGAFDLLGTWR